MTAFASFLMAISFLMAFLNFFPQLAPEEPAWLNKAYNVFSSVPLALGSFLTGFVLIFIFG